MASRLASWKPSSLFAKNKSGDAATSPASPVENETDNDHKDAADYDRDEKTQVAREGEFGTVGAEVFTSKANDAELNPGVLSFEEGVCILSIITFVYHRQNLFPGN